MYKRLRQTRFYQYSPLFLIFTIWPKNTIKCARARHNHNANLEILKKCALMHVFFHYIHGMVQYCKVSLTSIQGRPPKDYSLLLQNYPQKQSTTIILQHLECSGYILSIKHSNFPFCWS